MVADARDRAAHDLAVAAVAVMDGGRPLSETDPLTLDLLLDVDTRGVSTNPKIGSLPPKPN